MQRRFVVAGASALAIVVALGAAMMAGCGKKKSGDAEVLAAVNGAEITRGDVVKMLEQQGGAAALQELISRQLIREKAKERGITATDEEINRRVNVIADGVLMKTGMPFEKWVKDNGQSVEDYREQSRLQVLLSKLVIPTSAAKSFFEANKDQLKGLPFNTESVLYRRIVVASKADGEGIRKQVAAAKDKDAEFAKLAKEKSLDPATRPLGGMAEPMLKGQAVPAEAELAKALFALKPGEVSAPLAFSTPGGTRAGEWQVVTVVKHYPPHEMRLEDNEDVIEQAILRSQTSDPQVMRVAMEAQQFFASLPAKANIEVLSPRYKAVGDWFKEQREEAAKAQNAPGAVPPGGAAPSVPGTTP